MLEAIKKQIEIRYKSISNPDYSETGIPTKEVLNLKNKIEKNIQVIDTIDTNDDVGFVLSFTDNHHEYSVMISWIGSYAVILKINKEGVFVILIMLLDRVRF